VLRLERRYLAAVAAGFAIVAALGLLILSERFRIGMPAIIDDWAFATGPPRGVHDLLSPFVNSGGIGGGRFRPSWELWSYAEWHTLGAPGHMVGPNLFAGLRLLLCCAALAIVPGVVAATTRPRPDPVLLAALCVAAGLLLFSSPATDLDFLRLGTQEPLLFGATVSGTALVAWAAGRLIEGRRDGKQRGLAYAALAGGLLLWAFGIYHKEASVVMLAGAPFLYLHLDRRWRERGILDRPLWRERAFLLVVAAMLVPVGHEAIGSLSVSGQGIGLYGNQPPSSIGGWLSRLVDASRVAWDTPGAIGMPEWRYFVLALVALTVVVTIRRRRAPWLALGLVAAGLALLVSQAVLLVPISRYQIPGFGLFAIAAVLLLAESPPWLGWAAVAAALTLAISNYSDTRNALDAYAAWETNDNDGTIRLVAGFHPASCPIYTMNLVREQAESFPKLVGLTDERLRGPCSDGFSGVLVGYEQYPGGPLGVDDSVRRACADPGGPVLIRQTPGYRGFPRGYDAFPPLQVLGCRRFAPKLDGDPIADVLRRSRLVPGVGNDEVRLRCAVSFGGRRCFPPAAQP
jgi:hypothetical protein